MGKREFPEAFPHFHNEDREASASSRFGTEKNGRERRDGEALRALHRARRWDFLFRKTSSHILS